ncbi:MAG: hypothetical protein Q4C04_01345 [Clostridia bacterium]|nr:hypothetical protein [Clostridia bacterium]
MEKRLYSLMLAEEVVGEIDRLARRDGTNRSNLINQILAEYVQLMTPEKRIGSILGLIESAFLGNAELKPSVEPNQLTMSLKSSLSYRYRPTIRYEVQLYRVPNGAIGELSVIFRTQSPELLRQLASFFRLIKRLEDVYLTGLIKGGVIEYALYAERFTRSIAIPKDRNYSNEELAEAISAYIGMFDALMKDSLAGMSARELENRYLAYLNRGVGLI